MIGKVIIMGVITVVVIVATVILVFSMQSTEDEAVPNVKLVSFGSDKQEIKVGETANVFFNVANAEEKTIDDARVAIVIEPSGYEPYLSISNRTIDLPTMLGKDARTGEIKVSITATGSPAREAVYVVKGILFAGGMQSDIKEFELKIRQE